MSSSTGRFVSKTVAVLTVVLGIFGMLLVAAPVGSADPLDCGAVAARIEAHNQAAAVHNASPPNPSDEAAVAAYNAEAERGNAEIPELQSLAEQCRAEGHDVPQVGALPKPDAPQPCPAALIIAAAAPNPSCPPSPAPGPAPTPSPSPAPAKPRTPSVPLPPRSSTGPALPNPAMALPPLSRIIRNPAIPQGGTYNPSTLIGNPAPAQPALLPNSMVNGPNAFRVLPAPANPLQAPGATGGIGPAPDMTAMQQEFFANAFQIQRAAQGVLRPSNATPQVFALPNPDGTNPVADQTPVILIAGDGGNVLASPLDDYNRSGGLVGYVTPAMVGTGGSPSIKIPGASRPYQRGHLCANVNGCPGDLPQFLTPELGAINTGIIRDWDVEISKVVSGARVADGIPQQNVSLGKIPLYVGDNAIPDYILMWAIGDKGWNPGPVLIQNF
ncbi:hypothetical protein [Nocardia violaceofusca]|uniref:hypothetical protein n=1 Tax=Nocardia violaceofusca TaxID=941182 RepID=UPI000AE8375B|nr:hypothetical protein [Nocardia violaceofusca]